MLIENIECKKSAVNGAKFKHDLIKHQGRLDKVKQELEALRKDQETAEEYAEKCYDLEAQLVKKEKELKDLEGAKKNLQLTKTVCYELEDQIKEYERIIEKLESSQER